MTRKYICWFYEGDEPMQEITFESSSRAGSRQNEEDAIDAIAKKYGWAAARRKTIQHIVLSWRSEE